MLARLVDLAALLRASGVRISPAEVADAARAAAAVGVEDRAALRAALRATLAKRRQDAPVFEACFEVWTGALGRAVAGAERGLVGWLRGAGLASDDVEAVAAALGALLGGMTPAGRAVLAGEPGLLARVLAEAAAGIEAAVSPGGAAFAARRLAAHAGAAGAEVDAAALAAALRARGLSPRTLAVVDEGLRAALRRLDAAARRLADAHAGAGTPAAPGALDAGSAVSPEERARAEAAVRRLAERLRTRLVRRDRSRRRGPLAVRRTLRANLGTGGVPARLVFRSRRRPERPEVMVLCDVSDSVRHVTRLMLLFLFTLQALFSRVRSFVFVADLAEVTAALAGESDPARAADRVVAARAVPLAANSDYGRALRTFLRDHLASVGRRTTVIVIGDGRSNDHPAEAWALDEVRRRARRLLWICPERRAAWGRGDSEMPAYAARCDRVAVASTLEELEALAEQLVPRR